MDEYLDGPVLHRKKKEQKERYELRTKMDEEFQEKEQELKELKEKIQELIKQIN